MNDRIPEHGNRIGGEWRAAHSGMTFESRDPADDRTVIGTFAASDASDIAAAPRLPGVARSCMPSERS